MNQNLKVGDLCVIVSGLLEDNIGKSVVLEIPLPHGSHIVVGDTSFLNTSKEMSWVVSGENLSTLGLDALTITKGSPVTGIRERHLRKIGDGEDQLVKEKEKENAIG